MTEAMEAFLPVLFREKGLRQVWGAHYAGNWRSSRVLSKCGFRYQNSRTEEAADLGEVRLTYFYVLTEEAWRERHSGAL